MEKEYCLYDDVVKFLRQFSSKDEEDPKFINAVDLVLQAILDVYSEDFDDVLPWDIDKQYRKYLKTY